MSDEIKAAIVATEVVSEEVVRAGKILSAIEQGYANKGKAPREYHSDRSGRDFRVYSAAGSLAEEVLGLASRQSVGDAKLSIVFDSVLGTESFDHEDSDGFKFAFANKKNTGEIEFHMSKPSGLASISSTDSLGDIDIDLD